MQLPFMRHVVPAGQSLPASANAPMVRHAAQRPMKSQIGVVPEQFMLEVHCTHVEVIVSHTGAAIVVH